MDDTRFLYKMWQKVRPVKPWYFLVLAVVAGCLSVWSLRQNSFEMARLRQDVYQADKDDGDVQKALQNLQMYVTRHMNADLSGGPNAPYPPVQLLYTYDRAVKASGDAVTAANSKLYSDAQHYCEQNGPAGFYGANRIGCVQQYLHDHAGLSSTPVIDDSLYKFDFASPWWSPDVAGWSLGVAMLSLVAFLVTWLIRRMLRRAV